MDTWGWLVSLREELLDQLMDLSPEQWDAATLCPGWRVRDVVAHTILPERMMTVAGLVTLARAGFSLRRALHGDAVTRGSVPVEDLLDAYRAGIHRRTVPPGRTAGHVLDDLFIHAQDIRRPLGLTWRHDPELLARVITQVSADRALGIPNRIAGLRLFATDVDWSSEPAARAERTDRGGAGGQVKVGSAEVSGPAEPLILAMAGRAAALADLSGDGVTILASRL